MNRNLILLVALLLLQTKYVQAQNDSVRRHRKIFEHRVGVQVNELVRQVFNFNNSSVTLNNPYLLTYSISFVRSGWGLRIGLGPNYKEFKNDDGITKQENNINTINARLGIQKVFKLSDKWSAGVGIDGIFGNDISYTKTYTHGFDSSATDVASSTQYLGGGGMGWLRYHISPRIHIGTETGFYYRTGIYKQKVSIAQRNGNIINGEPQYKTVTTDVDNKLREGKFNLPMVFYLVVMF